MCISAYDDAVVVRLVEDDCAFGAGFVTDVESDFVSGIEFPCAFVFFEGKA